MANRLEQNFPGFAIENRRQAQKQLFPLVPVERSLEGAELDADQAVIKAGFGYLQTNPVVLDIVDHQRPKLFHDGSLKNAHLLRCARLTRSDVLPEYVSTRRPSRASHLNLFERAELSTVGLSPLETERFVFAVAA